jgi:hypothetical protein
LETCFVKYLRKLVGNTDIEDSLQRLDRLTQEEARMASAESLKVTHDVERKVDDVHGDMQDIGNQVQNVDERVQVVGDDVQDVGNKVHHREKKCSSLWMNLLAFTSRVSTYVLQVGLSLTSRLPSNP